jgi:hypothetical protein
VPHQQAGHMTAPDQCCINVKKLLSIRRRPHMTRGQVRGENVAPSGAAQVRSAIFLGCREIRLETRVDLIGVWDSLVQSKDLRILRLD